MDSKIVFLFLQGIHQIYHLAPIAMELGKTRNNPKIQLISCHSQHTSILKNIQKLYPGTNVEIITLPLPFRFRFLNFKKKAYPSPHDTMRFAKKYMKDAVAVVSTSHITPRLCRKLKITKPKFIYQYHGCGDRKYGFDPKFKEYDFMLLPGKYHQKRLIDENIMTPEKTKIIGWPKLDIPIQIQKIKNKIFSKNLPTVLYAPHWKPELTSYKIWGEKILRFFSNQTDFNLIFAPHIQLKHWQFAYKYKTDYENYRSENIHIDFGSEYSVNGTYLKIADIYIGDVSSIVYEWIALKPRPCVFLNAHGVNWKNNVNYRFWDYGPVVEKIENLENKIKEAVHSQNYLELQRKRIKEYMELTEESSSKRAAKAILEFLGKKII